MKPLSWIGLIVPILGVVSLVIPLPRNEREGVRVGGVSIGIETRQRLQSAAYAASGISAIVPTPRSCRLLPSGVSYLPFGAEFCAWLTGGSRHNPGVFSLLA
jgi:hypothetical protein